MWCVVVFLDCAIQAVKELLKCRNVSWLQSVFDGLPRQLVGASGSLLVHVYADVAVKLFGQAHQNGSVRALNDAPALRVVGQCVGDGSTQAINHFIDGFVLEACPVIHIEHAEHASVCDAVA